MLLGPPKSTLFPYTTLFRSARGHQLWRAGHLHEADATGRDVGQAVEVAQRRDVDAGLARGGEDGLPRRRDRKSTRLNSSHVSSPYAVCCVQKKMPALSGRLH